MSFNFGSLATAQATSTTQQRLKPWNIYPVTFMGAKIDHIQGKKDVNATYDILKVRFESENGYYEESIFYPKDNDQERPKYTSRDGHDYEGASSFERTMTFIAQVATVLNPEGFKKMQAASSKFTSFDDVAKAFVKVTDAAKGKQTNLKLVGGNRDGQVVPKLPKFVAVNKQGELFTCDNFIGDKLFFSDWENKQREQYLNAKPTPVEDPVGIDTPITGSEDAIDFDSLL